MAFNSSEFHFYYQLKPCALRVYLGAQGLKRQEPDAFHKLLERLGQRHEQRHLITLGEHANVGGDVDATRAAVTRRERVIYQPGMRIVHEAYGELVGVPDFFILDGEGYLIRDCKLSRRFGEEYHPEISRQLELYGWLFEKSFGMRPTRLEAYMGDGQLQIVPFEPAQALRTLAFILDTKKSGGEPVEAIGWSKCLDCAYNNFCWSRAKERHDVGLLPGVDQALARSLRLEGITTYDQLLERYDQAMLAEVKKEVGGKLRRVGNAATKILHHAKAFQSGQLIQLKLPTVKKAETVVMFDVEGIPPHLEHSERTYLWGLKVFGEKSRPYSAALAEAGPEGDREGWQRFLQECQRIFAEYGTIPFIHWSAYEKTQVRKYVEKYGDRDGLAGQVLESLHDLRPVVEEAFVLPTPSYGLKLIEQIAGYTRKLPEAGGKWSMATYIESVESDDPKRAAALISEIIKYNEEDLDALWAVYCWSFEKS
jgi:predicted RecB family nuclease